MPGFAEVVKIGFRTVYAVWIAPVLLLVLLAPLQIGVFAEILALRSSGRQLPPEMIVIAIIGHSSILWWPVVFFGFPWILGGAATWFRDRLAPTERPRGHIEQANQAYGRSFALMLLFGVVLAALFVSLFALPFWLLIRDEFFAVERPRVVIIGALSHPTMLEFLAAGWMAAGVVVVAWALSLAAVAVDDLDLLRATWRVLLFVREHRADTARLWLFVILTGLPGLIPAWAVLYAAPNAMTLAAIGIGAALCSAYAIMLNLAVAETLYLSRRTTISAG